MNTDKKNTDEAKAVPVFTFRRMSGLDQAMLSTDEEWFNLDRLDPQIWMALSCPTRGLEFDKETLDALDTDKDGRIRAQDVRDAVQWVCRRLTHPAALCEENAQVSMENLREDTAEGKACAQALRLVLDKFAKSGRNEASLGEISTVLAEASGYAFNGDGIVTLASVQKEDSPIGRYLVDALAISGGKLDATGQPGIDASLAEETGKRAQAVLQWRESLKQARLPLGDKTGKAWTLYTRLAPKIDDFFCRCNLAAYDPQTLARLENRDEEGEAAQFTPETLAALPLAKVSPAAQLQAGTGINPAWAKDLDDFFELMKPLLNKGNVLTEKNWQSIKSEFAGYEQLLDSKPAWPLPAADAEKVEFAGLPALALAGSDDPLGRHFLPQDPNIFISNLDDARLRELAGEDLKRELQKLIEEDLAAPPLSAFQDLRRLALFHANLYTFLMNFLSFRDFYDPQKKAIFQEGVLYLDSRACLLCVPVEDVDNHARLAAQSHLCLIYCSCTRKAEDGAELAQTIAAALTIGNLAALIEGRHGLFIDNDGNEWDTKILRVVHNPISLREAMWAPYIRISNMAAEQVNKFIAAKDKAAGDALQKAAQAVTKPAEAKQGFDFAKGAGIFAALSVALSVLSAAFAYIANSLASLGWWWPLALVGVLICISGPSMLIAYFKLRKRSLGPLLDASGWAVNQGAPINIVMGMALTTMGKLPRNAQRDFNDPYALTSRMKNARRKRHFWLIILLLIILALCAFAFYCQFINEPVWVTKARLYLGI